MWKTREVFKHGVGGVELLTLPFSFLLPSLPGNSASHWNAWTPGSVALGGLCTQVAEPLILILSICEMGTIAVPTPGQ